MKFTEGMKIAYALTNTFGIGNITARKILDAVKRRDIPGFLDEAGGFCAPKDLIEIKASFDRIDFDVLERKWSKKNISAVMSDDEYYPESLKPYPDMPPILYYKGNPDLFNLPCFAVVGTRYPTRYGLRATEDFVSKLSERFCIVSGMARGIDSAAHRTALNSGGKTIAILGSGVDVIYPAENVDLSREIADRGLLVSEYEPGTFANGRNFPARNRIISGLSRGVLVTEAGLKSGTTLTINSAEKQGKAVFCVPGGIYSDASAGCNRSIKLCQSRAVTDVNDIYDELGLSSVDVAPPSLVQLDFNEEKIASLLSTNGEMHFEEILGETSLTVPQLNSLLVKMETAGIIRKTKYNYWSV